MHGRRSASRPLAPQGPRKPLSYPEVTLDTLLSASAVAHPNRPALVTATGSTTSFADLNALVSRWAAVLSQELGVERGAVVAVNAALDPWFAVGYYGALRAGNIVVPLNPLLPAPVVVRLLRSIEARVAVVTAEVAERLRPVRDELAGLHLIVLDAAIDPAAKPPTMAELVATAALAMLADPRVVDLEDVGCVQFTSGTTGTPKAVLLSHRNLTTNALQIAAAHELSANSVAANHLPTYHPMHLNSAVAVGATQLLCTTPDPVEAVERAARHGATHFYSLPVRLSRLAMDERLPRLNALTLRMIASGGSALPSSAATTLGEHFQVPVVQGYGLAETSPLTHSDVLTAPKVGSVGPPVADTECRVVHLDTRTVLGPGDIGEVQVRGPQVMKGYLGQQQSGISPDGWFDTGDVGRIDGDGYLFLVDRIKDVFKCDNWLVSPSSVERMVVAQPHVRECCVVDVPDEFSGAVACALIVPTAPDVPHELLRAEVSAANEQLPYYERIRDCRVVPDIPRTGNGKISRADLRSRFFDGNTLDTTTGGTTMVTLVNKFVVSGDPERFEQIWKASSEFMRKQPGFISFRLVRSIGDSTVYINIAQWADAESHQQVMGSESFKRHIDDLATVARPEPHLCHEVIAHGTA
jgi:long-chain acyl-CoA synthetase